MAIFTATAIGGTAGALIGGGLAASGIGSIVGGIGAAKAGSAQADAAQQQVQQAREALQAQMQARSEGIAQASAAAALSPGEINSINQMLTTRDTALNASLSSIQKQQASLDQLDPSVKAAGQNLYSLLTGKAAEILAPMQTQMNNQRQSLMNQLSSQMGPGFMTSSAGIEALSKFDSQSALSLGTAQLQAMQTVGAQYGALSGLQQQGQNAITAATQGAYGQAQTANSAALQAYQFATNRQTSALLGAMSANPINPFGVPGAQQSVVNTAGAPYAGAGYAAGQLGSMGSNLGFMGMLSGMGGGAAGANVPEGTGAYAASPLFGDYGKSAVGNVGANGNPFGSSISSPL